jgi:phosphoglycolate phosphatase-like HAD superfamily hydrolase
MVDYFEKNIDKKYIKILPGVKDCLDIFEKRNVILGIVSGGLEKIVEIKLKIACIEKYFKLGAFGDFSEKRSDLVKYAIKKAEKIYREVSKKDIFIVGDTPLDIECGKVNGVKTIAIATGYYSEKDLLKYKPDYVFRNFLEFKNSIDTIFK